VPQSSQNADEGAFSAPHFGQRRDSWLPHAAQNFLFVVLSVPHLVQRIGGPGNQATGPSSHQTADSANAWIIPMGADVGRVFKVVSQDFSLQVGTYGLLKRPDGAPQWIVRVNLTLLFPRMH
jgi:hypothetical protein